MEPSNPLDFTLAGILSRRNGHCASLGDWYNVPIPTIHRLQCGLLGYLIRLATHTLAPQRQSLIRRVPSPLVLP